MLKITVGTELWELSFRHSKANNNIKGSSRETSCVISELTSKGILRVIGKGKALIYPPFHREIGRKWALKRAVCNHVFNMITKRCKKCGGEYNSFCLRLTKEQRTAVWLGYFNRPRPNSKPRENAVAPIITAPHAFEVSELVAVACKHCGEERRFHPEYQIPAITDGGTVVPLENRQGTYHAGA